ncbi:MAG: peptidoglycan-binding protein [Nitrospira sp.]
MINTKVLESNTVSQKTRTLTLAVVGVASLLMFGLALTASAATLTRQLELGMRGADVSDLQTFLAQDNTIYPQGLVTGFFGTLTQSAVSNFQSRNGIATVGRVGPVTIAAINAQMGGGVSGLDRSSPFIYPLSINTSNSTATFNWSTSENSSAIIYYSTSPISMIEGSPTSSVTIGGNSFLVHADLRVSHTGTLTNLNPNTVYNYVVYVRDGNGNESITWPATFQTAN